MRRKQERPGDKPGRSETASHAALEKRAAGSDISYAIRSGKRFIAEWGTDKHAKFGREGQVMRTRVRKTPAAAVAPACPVQRYVDRFGRLHTAAVFDVWSEAAVRAMQLRPYDKAADAVADHGRPD